MADPAQRRTLDEIEHETAATAERAGRLDRIDGAICNYRARYLKCVWAGHDGEAEAWEVEVDRLLDIRTLVQRGLLTPVQVVEVDAL